VAPFWAKPRWRLEWFLVRNLRLGTRVRVCCCSTPYPQGSFPSLAENFAAARALLAYPPPGNNSQPTARSRAVAHFMTCLVLKILKSLKDQSS